MPPRARLGDHLTEQNLIDLTAAVSAGKRATVYLIEATPSLGLPAGCSAKVVSVDGSTVLIRPKGVNDELPFEADELRLTRTPAQPATKPKPTPKPAAASPRTRSASARAALERSAASAPAPKPTPAQPKSVDSPTTTPKAAVTAPKSDVPDAAPAPKRPRRTKEPVGVSVTLHAAAGGEWTVTVAHGAKRPGKAAPVTADAVERAVRELGDPAAAEAVESVISAAREAAAKRVEELSRQLEEARNALESLGS